MCLEDKLDAAYPGWRKAHNDNAIEAAVEYGLLDADALDDEVQELNFNDDA